MPDDYVTAWRKADEEYDRRYRQEVADRIEALTREHNWAGGFYCRCGHPITWPTDWGRHILELALFDDPEPQP
jgi:hypothetical protein